MAVSFTNAWKVSVEETIQNAVKNEFFGSIPVLELLILNFVVITL